MEVIIVNKLSFSVIGKMGQGSAKEGPKWIPPLWKEANENFHELKSLTKLDSGENILGIWGAMSDIEEKFERWGKAGKYLAGCEVIENATPPVGWTKWVIPSYTYAVINCCQEMYGKAFDYMLNEYIPQNNYSIVGAIQEFYPQDGTNELCLYFPIAKL